MATDETLDQEPRHPIRVVSERTGLSPDVLRAWEKRYGAVAPPRRDGGAQRLYSDADVERLRLLRRVTTAGRSIGQVAELTDPQLAALVREDEAQRAAVLMPRRAGDAAAAALERALEAARALDGPALEGTLRRALMAVGAVGFIDEVAVPFLRAVGDAWEEGRLGVAHEHLASAVVRRVLAFVAETVEPGPGARDVVVATPQRQAHELGALLAAASAAASGWRVTYLGADLPAEEIASAARQKGAAAVALSVLYPADEGLLAVELRRLRRELPAMPIVLGGDGARRMGRVLDETRATYLPSLAEFRRALARLALESANGNGKAR